MQPCKSYTDDQGTNISENKKKIKCVSYGINVHVTCSIGFGIFDVMPFFYSIRQNNAAALITSR